MPLAYVVNPLDRCANERSNTEWLTKQSTSPFAKTILVNGDQVVVRGGRLVTDQHPASPISVFLGLDGDRTPWFASKTETTDDLVGLRGLAMDGVLPAEQLGMLAQARSLIQWHERRSFCSNCGGRNESADAGYRRHCPACGMDHFPRTDPVVIMVVRHEGRILLGRQQTWLPGMYSALAGFVEPGETIEDAARREIFEESGIRVGKVEYVTSQPWPFLSNLMIGLIGEAVTTEIKLDEKELEDARWFTSAEARQMLERTHPDGFYAANPIAIAHELVRTALQLP